MSLAKYAKKKGIKLPEAGSTGRIIGKTESGKDVYSHAKNPAHEGFSKQDHLDAMEVHVNAQGPLEHKIQQIERDKMSGHARGTRGYDHSGQVNAIDQRKHHAKMAQMHSDMADDAGEY